MGWAKRLLRVNLTAGTVKEEATNMDWAAKYLGQRGLGTKYLASEIDPKVDPLSPENKLIIVSGPLTGTNASTAGRWSVVTKSPLTGIIACSNSGGFFGGELKNAGWDMIIFEGKSPKPVFLSINNDKAELLPADQYWGKSIWHTEPAIKKQLGDDNIKVASIGEAGENGVLFAAIVNDLDRAAGRSGVGTVMGSKNLKAVAVRGTKGVQVKDPMGFMKATTAGKKVLADNPVTSEALPAFGTQLVMAVMNESGGLPTRNFRDVQFEDAGMIGAEAMGETKADGHKNLVRNAACFACTIQCQRVSKVNPNHWAVKGKPQYHKESGGLEYENAWSLGANTGVNDLDAITFANFLCNEHGMDPISLGATISAAMEMFEAGALTEKQIGFPLRFGDAEALVKITEMTGKGIGFGKEIGMGSKRLCAKYGKPELSMTVKGQEFPAYDPRAVQGMALAFATSNRGACHLRGYMTSPEVFGVPEKLDPHVTDGKAAMLIRLQNMTAVVDSAGICHFTMFAWGWDDIQSQIAAACGKEYTVENLEQIGERVWNLERQFNLATGMKANEDTLPQRLLKEAAKTGPAKGKVAELDKMLPQYYELRGWGTNGIPTSDTLGRLGV